MFGIKLFALGLVLLPFAAASPASADPLPDCANKFGAIQQANCQLISPDPTGLRFEKRVAGKDVEIRVLGKDGSAAQTITASAPINAGSGIMLLRDIDGDGHDDLLLSISDGGAHGNPDWAVWRPAGGSAQFQRMGKGLFGNEFWSAGEGYTASYASGGGWSVGFSRIENDAFALVAHVGRSAPAGIPEPGSPLCSLQDSPNLARYGFTKEAAEQKFCALAVPQLRARGLSDYNR
ncbi:MAG: hypothetical protein ACRC20_08445 [Segniliparus sp.]|uniref:hypothetical protein n=1 Tax=Segniliparus sp. TaxID=2804064 RepID=UPI003F40B8F6